MTKRVGIIGLLHESNTFLSQPTTLQDFEKQTLLEGDAIKEHFSGSHHEISGFLKGLANEPSIETVPIFVARAFPSGPIEERAWSHLVQRMLDLLAAAG